jgi:hypothetical protein
VEQRISALRSISHGGDLGPIDAELLVREVYRGSPVEVRTAAQEQVVNLAGGMTVAMAMLDLFSEARASDDLTRVIQEYTGRALPAARAAGWAVAARLALLEHVLQLRERAGVGGSRALGGGGSGLASETDALSRVLMSSYMHRVALARRQSVAMLPTLNDGDGPRLLVQARMDQARSVTGPRGSTPIAMPDSLEGLQRRLATREALAEGPVQHFVAHQLALIDLLAYLTVNEQPEKHEEVTAVLRALRETGRGGPSAPLRGNHVLEQSLHAELAMAALWKLRLRLDEIPTDMSSGGGT